MFNKNIKNEFDKSKIAGFKQTDMNARWFSYEHIKAALELKKPTDALKNISEMQVKKLFPNHSSQKSKTSALSTWRTGFSQEDKKAVWFTSLHLQLAKSKKYSAEQLRGISPLEAIGLEHGFTLDQVKNIHVKYKIIGLQVGFTPEDVNAAWFSSTHLKAAVEKNISIDTLRGISEIQARGLHQGLSSNQVQRCKHEYQIDGLLLGFPSEVVFNRTSPSNHHPHEFSEWHVKAVKEKGLTVAKLQGKSKFKAYAYSCGYSDNDLFGIPGRKLLYKLDCKLAGFSDKDIQAGRVSHEHLDAAKNGVVIDTLRKASAIEAKGLSQGLSYEQVQGCTAQQIEGLCLGFTREDVLSGWFTETHSQARKIHHVPIDQLRGTSAIEAHALGHRLPLEKIKGCTTFDQVNGIVAGFSLDDVLAPWFTMSHVYATQDHIPVELLRGASKLQVYGLTSGLTLEELEGFNKEYQITALMLGFTRDHVLAQWFTDKHFEAARTLGKGKFNIETLKKATETELLGMGRGLSYEQVKGCQWPWQIDGLKAGFSRNDVLSRQYGPLHFFAVLDKDLTVEQCRTMSFAEIWGCYMLALSQDQVRGCTKYYQCFGIKAGIALDEVLKATSPSNPESFREYIDGKCAKETRNMPKITAYALYKGLTYEESKRCSTQSQVDALAAATDQKADTYRMATPFWQHQDRLSAAISEEDMPVSQRLER